ncbi:hypothetical protein AX15_007712 [Amanita polypyramis BW_CC]|nr:hypothetical protein AX15_007712 [Amanita polypyramis BW_CC]
MMNVLKNQSFFRPSSQPVSPSPVSTPPPSDSHAVSERPSRPLNMLSLSNFRRPSPVSRVQSPPLANMIQDCSYLETLSLKLSEAVTRALAQPLGPAPAHEVLSGKRPIPQGRGHTLGALIVSELKTSQDNAHLHRAKIRTLQKPLSVLLTNLSAYLSPLLTSPSIQASSVNALNVTQIHVLAIATFAAELLEKFEELDDDGRSDFFKTVRGGLISLVTRAVDHLVNGVKNELLHLMNALESPTSNTSAKNVNNGKILITYHPSVVTLQNIMPQYVRYLTRCTAFADAQSILATFLISVVWRALVALAHRPRLAQLQSSSPVLQMAGAKMNHNSPTTTPPVTPPLSRFTIKLPPSRPPSPHSLPVVASAAADARALYELLCQLPRPTGQNEATILAREAVDEAFNGLTALGTLLEETDKATYGTNFRMDHDTSDLPLLIVLPVLQTWNRDTSVSIANMVGLSEEEYRRFCLSGFGRAEECEAVVARRVLDTLRKDTNVDPALRHWIEKEVSD